MSEFKVGDRVVSNGYYFGKLHDGCKGIVVRVSSYDCLVNFDDDVGGHTVCLMDIPIRHGLFVHHDNLTLVEREESKVIYASELMELARKEPGKYEGKRYKVTDTLIDRHSREYETAIVRSGTLRVKGDNELFAHVNSVTRLEEILPEPKPVTFKEAVTAAIEGKKPTIELDNIKYVLVAGKSSYPDIGYWLTVRSESGTTFNISTGMMVSKWYVKE